MNVTYIMRLKTYMLVLSMMMFLMPSLLLAEPPKNLAVFYELDGNAEAQYNKIVSEVLPTIGFNSADPHRRVNDQYKTKYGSTTLDVLSFLPVVNDDNVMPLFNIDPRLAGFAPFNMLIHKKIDENVTHVGHLTPEAMLDILGITDNEVKEKFVASFKPLDALLDKEFGATQKSYKTYSKLSDDTMINFEYEFERPDDMDDFVDEFQNKFEMSFINKEYLIAGFHNFKDTDNGEEMLKDYDIFWGYSLCHLGYSYNMFDNEGARPDAGLFAPCTMYMYVKKGTNTLVVGMPKLVNILDTLDVDDAKRVGLVEKLDKEIPEILTAFGMRAVTNVNPLVETPQALEVKKVEANGETVKIMIPTPPAVPKPIQVETLNGSGDSNYTENSRAIKFSKRYPPNYVFNREIAKTATTKRGKIGEVNNGHVATFLRGKLMDVATATQKLKDAGFEVLATESLNKTGTITSIVFTNDDLKKMASKPYRGFMGTLRLTVNDELNETSITNPVYLTKAFLQDDYDANESQKLLTSLTTAFEGLENSKDTLKFQLLPNYQFMMGMPYYKDMEVIARGNDLLAKIKANKKSSKKIVFELQLANGATLLGVRLEKRTNKFPEKIGTNNIGMLPYPILIENGEAKILEPKYYISVMYPLLKMEEFMTIATIPGAIIKDCTKLFR